MATVDDWKGILDQYETQLKSSAKGVGAQFVLMSTISILTFIGFSFFRPRVSKVYAPKVTYHSRTVEDSQSETDGHRGYDPNELPELKPTFLGWINPVYRATEDQMMANMGLDAATFLRFVRMMVHISICIALLSLIVGVIYCVYNVKFVPLEKRSDGLSMFTVVNVKGAWMWAALVATYLINLVVIYFVWRNWKEMIDLRHKWFSSPSYQNRLTSRTLMITGVPKQYRSDNGLKELIMRLNDDGLKKPDMIEATCIGRALEDFPELVQQHNEAIIELEKVLVKYLKGGQVGKKKPMIRVGGKLGKLAIGGTKVDAIEHYATEIKSLRDQIAVRRKAIDQLYRKTRARRGIGAGLKAGVAGIPLKVPLKVPFGGFGDAFGPRQPVAGIVADENAAVPAVPTVPTVQRQTTETNVAENIEGENYGFVTLKTIAEAHRIADQHRGKLVELDGASLQLASLPHDIVWENIVKTAPQIKRNTTYGFTLIGLVCFFNTVPLTVIALLANLAAFADTVPFIKSWQTHQAWLLSIVSGVLPSAIQGVCGYLLPAIIRRISKYQGALTRSRLERAVIARYFFFTIASSFIILMLLSVIFNLSLGLMKQIQEQASFGNILEGLSDLPNQIQSAYVSMSNYWLTWLPLRGFLLLFELVQLIKLALVSMRQIMFSYTPRQIRQITGPRSFPYAIVSVNLLFLMTVGLSYATLAPLVSICAMFTMAFSLVVYKYQLLFVYETKAESGGRMWDVYVNRLFASCILMQLLMVLTTALVRKKWLDSVAAVPPILFIMAFKVYISRNMEPEFRCYRPSPQELQEQKTVAEATGPVKSSDVVRRFMHPALMANKLFHVEVHMEQMDAARDVLQAYGGWERNEVRGVDEKNLPYDENRDGPSTRHHREPSDSDSSVISKSAAGPSSQGLAGFKIPSWPMPLGSSSKQRMPPSTGA